MARSSGSTLQASLALKERIIALAATGLTQTQIAAEVRKNQGYISRVLRQQADGRLAKHQRKASALETAVAIKDEDGYAGPHTLAYELFKLGYDESEIPAKDTLHRAVKEDSAVYKPVGGKGDTRGYHSYFRGGLTAPCQRVQLDGWGPFTICGEVFYLLVAKDSYSRMVYAEAVPHKYGAYLQPFIRNMVAALGVPTELQLDNAVTWRCNAKSPGRLVWAALQAGIQRIHFIPESQPTRNGGVERVNWTIALEFFRRFQGEEGYTFPTTEDFQARFREYLNHYNYGRQHRALPKRPGSRRFHCTPGEVHQVRTEKAQPGDQSIAFTRLMVNPGYCVLHSSVVASCPSYAGSYLTWECHWNGSGRVLHKGQEVGTFEHGFTGRRERFSPVIEARGVQGETRERYYFDAITYAKEVLDHQKRKRPRMSLLPQSYRIEDYELDGLGPQWRILDEDDGILFDSLNVDADHIGEFLTFEEAA
jgi:hypothetical protein